MPSWLSFHDRRQEQAWQLKWAAEQLGLDAAISLQTLLFPSLVARTLWEQLGGSDGALVAIEAPWMAVFLGWALLHLLLAALRPAAYLRFRTPLVLLSRLQRQLTIVRYAALFNREAMGLAGAAAPAGALPATLGGTLGMLLWRPGSVASLLCTYTLPLKYSAPSGLLLVAASLHSSLAQCVAECRGGAAQSFERLYTQVAQRLREWLAPRSTGAITAAARQGAAAVGATGGAAGGSCAAGGCVHSCLAVHSWLQVVLGVLLPLGVIWAVEETSRLRFQQQWLQHHEAPGDDAAGSVPGSGGATPAADPGAAGLRPLPLLALAAWVATCAWALWVLAEAVLL